MRTLWSVNDAVCSNCGRFRPPWELKATSDGSPTKRCSAKTGCRTPSKKRGAPNTDDNDLQVTPTKKRRGRRPSSQTIPTTNTVSIDTEQPPNEPNLQFWPPIVNPTVHNSMSLSNSIYQHSSRTTQAAINGKFSPKKLRRPKRVFPDATKRFAGWLSTDGPLTTPIHNIGPMTFTCDHCDAFHWAGEAVESKKGENLKFGKCCQHGDTKLADLPESPDFLRDLLLGTDPRCKDFKKNVRRYNAAFSFVSLESKVHLRHDNFASTVFQIQGALYHRTGPFEPEKDRTPSYNQLYFLDPNEASSYRMSLNDRLNHDIVTQLSDYIYHQNPYVTIYATAKERFDQTIHELRRQGETDQAIKIKLNPEMKVVVEIGADRRRENLPTSADVAGMLPDTNAPEYWREIHLAERGLDGDIKNALVRMPVKHPAYMPLAYPLMWPKGGEGFDTGLLKRNLRNKVQRERDATSLREWFRYHLYQRRNDQTVPFAFCRLFQQFLVDAWASIEQEQLNWIRRNQNDLRKHFRDGLEDALGGDSVNLEAQGRKSTYLPAAFVGSDRFMNACYQDSMALVRFLTKPTLFLTVTANPNWPEIKEHLLPGQVAADRPDIGVRVFNLKRQAILDDIKAGCFGDYAGMVWTVEYQKRGLPHMHCLIFLKPSDSDRYLNPQNIDKVICAEIPGPDIDPDGVLGKVISSYMIHGPCNDVSATSPCMEDGVCKKRFPKAFAQQTTVPEDGYPTYRRRKFEDIPGMENVRGVDNRWVVPYNPFLSRKYQAHINVEICATVKAVKYIHKYIHKGTDRITAQLGIRDEVTDHLNGRFIGPFEAPWRIFEFPTHDMQPSVMGLDIHLPGKDEIALSKDASRQKIQHKLERPSSKLLAWFRYNKAHATFHDILYQNFPWVCKFKDNNWVKRKNKGHETIGRMWSVSPRDGERFWLRMLLTIIPGATDWVDLRTYEGKMYLSFHEACKARGLSTDDKQWEHFFEESRHYAGGRQLRDVFCYAMKEHDVVNPRYIWDLFADDLCDDLTPQIDRIHGWPRDLENPSQDYGLFLIQKALTPEIPWGLTGLPAPVFQWGDITGNRLLQEELDYDRTIEAASERRNIDSLNGGQRTAFETITSAIRKDASTAHFYLQGPAGTGKTFLYQTVCHHYRAQGHIVLCVASSGIAGLLLPGGRTAHARFKIPFQLHEDSMANVRRGTDLAALIQKAKLIIWDEVTMQHKHAFEAVDRMLRDIRHQDSLFGGIPAVLGGDFAQILPVVRKGARPQTVNACLQKSKIWIRLRKLFLTENMRLTRAEPENSAFADWLHGLSYNTALAGLITLPPRVGIVRSEDDLFDHVYPQTVLNEAVKNNAIFERRSILCVHNARVDSINFKLIDRMPGKIREYHSADEVLPSDRILVERPETEYLHSLKPSGTPPSKLRLKIGAPIILLRNTSPETGMCNGTRLSVTGLYRYSIRAKVLGGRYHGEERIVPRIKLIHDGPDQAFSWSRRQFPVQLSFAITINKSQGQSFDIVGVDQRVSTFSHGQFYVAMSRTTSVGNLRVLMPENEDSEVVQNIVYPEVLDFVNRPI